jgi:hypothetical protein
MTFVLTDDTWTPNLRAPSGLRIPPPPPRPDLKMVSPAEEKPKAVELKPTAPTPTPRSGKNLPNRGRKPAPTGDGELVMGLNGKLVTRRTLKKQRNRLNRRRRVAS